MKHTSNGIQENVLHNDILAYTCRLLYVTFFGKTDTNAFPFIWQNRLQSVYTHLNALKKIVFV